MTGTGLSGTQLSGTEREQLRRAFAYVRLAARRARDQQVASQARRLTARILAATGTPERRGGLTDREVDVLALAAIGERNAEIAGCLGVTAETVKSYLGSAMDKLGAGTRHAAVRTARERGLLP